MIELQNRNGPCVHLGSQRKCCESLYICRESPGANCILSGIPIPPLRSCETCEQFVALTEAGETMQNENPK